MKFGYKNSSIFSLLLLVTGVTFLGWLAQFKSFQTIQIRGVEYFGVLSWTPSSRQFFHEFKLHTRPRSQLDGAAPVLLLNRWAQDKTYPRPPDYSGPPGGITGVTEEFRMKGLSRICQQILEDGYSKAAFANLYLLSRSW